MAPVAVVTDTCHYLPREILREHGITEVSLYVHWERGDQRESEFESYDEYWESLRSAPTLPTTSQPSIGDFLSAWEPLLEAGNDVCSVHLSGGLSGTCDSARQARAQLAERGMEDRVEVVDSTSACGGLGFLALAAAAAAEAGRTLPEVVEHVRATRADTKIWFAIETLEYLKRGGRIGGAQAWFGSALKIKPILTVEGEITPVERVRTSGRAFDRLVDYLRARKEDGATAWAIQHIQAPGQAERLVERGREIFETEPVFVGEIGPVIGTHVGPGLLGVSGIPPRWLEVA